jgi:hypothetical protein
MMNSHPEIIKGYGTLNCEVKDEETGAWIPLTINRVAVVEKSSFNLLGWTPFAKQLPISNAKLAFEGNTVRVPIGQNQSAVGSQRGGLFSLRCRLVAQQRPADDNKHLLAMPSKLLETTKQPDIDELTTEEKQQAEKGAVVIAKARALMYDLHRRLGHVVKIDSLQSMIRKGEISIDNAAVRKTVLQMTATELGCLECDLASANKTHPSKKNSAVTQGQWTLDESGKYWRSRRNNRYVTVVVAPEGRGVFVECLKKRSRVVDAIRTRRKIWQRIAGVKMTKLRMDRAGEHTGKKMVRYLSKHGIEPSFTSPNSSAGSAEAYIHILQDAMASMLNDYAKLHQTPRPHHLWDYAFEYAAEIKSMTWCTTNDGMSMYEKRHGREPPLHKCHVFGRTMIAHIPKELRRKGDNRGRIGRFLGFAKDGDGFVLYDSKKNSIFHSGSVRVLMSSEGEDEPAEAQEASALMGNEANSYEFGRRTTILEDAEAKHDFHSDAAMPKPEQALPVADAPSNMMHEAEDEIPRPSRNRTQVRQMNLGHDEWQTLITKATVAVDQAENFGQFSKQRCERSGKKAAHIARLQEKLSATRSYLAARRGGVFQALPAGMVPQNEQEMWSSEELHFWLAARKEELDGLKAKNVFTLVPRRSAKGSTVVGSKFVYDIKLRSPSCEKEGATYVTLPDGKKIRYKARLVGKGFTQKPGVHFDEDETYAPTPQITSVRLTLAIAFQQRWDTRQLDAKQAFLVSELAKEEQMLMEPPPGEDLGGDYLLLLLRSLYGLRQSAHHWHREIKGTLLKHGFECLMMDQGVYVKKDSAGALLCVLCLHVDDCLVAAPSNLLTQTTDALKATYEMSDEPADWFLKIKIQTSSDQEKMSLSQPEYARDIIRKAGLTSESNSVSTPMEKGLAKGGDDSGMTSEEETFMAEHAERYGTVVGMMSYLANATRPDLAYSINQLQKFTQSPRKCHWNALVRVARYLVGTLDHGIMFTRGKHADESRIMGYVDSDWAGNIDDRTSTSGYVFMFMNAAFSFKSKRQSGTKQGRTRPNEEPQLGEQQAEAKRDKRQTPPGQLPKLSCVRWILRVERRSGFGSLEWHCGSMRARRSHSTKTMRHVTTSQRAADGVRRQSTWTQCTRLYVVTSKTSVWTCGPSSPRRTWRTCSPSP